MTHLTGYESEDEWQRLTNRRYGKEWSNAGFLLGATFGAVLSFVVMVNASRGMNFGKAQVLMPVVNLVGMLVCGGVGWGAGAVCDRLFNPRARRLRNARRRKRRR